jgi:hypothetical protein
MHSDDVYRNQLGETILSLEGWARDNRDVAAIEIAVTPTYWKLSARPETLGACPFEFLLRADQKFNLAIGGEVYEDKPVDKFDFFGMLARAIAAGRVERIEVLNALTGACEALETRVTLEDGWAWIGERRIASRAPHRLEAAQELRTRRYLPYRR